MQEDSDQTLTRQICFTNEVTSLTRPSYTRPCQTLTRHQNGLNHLSPTTQVTSSFASTRARPDGTAHSFKVSLFQACHLKTLNVSNLAQNESAEITQLSLKRVEVHFICWSKWLQIINGVFASPFSRKAIWKIQVETENKISKLVIFILCRSLTSQYSEQLVNINKTDHLWKCY